MRVKNRGAAAGGHPARLVLAASAPVRRAWRRGNDTVIDPAGDRLTFVAAPLVLAGAALAACWLLGRRAARIEPMDALRVE